MDLYRGSVLEQLLAQDQRNAYRLYLSQRYPAELLPIGPRTDTKLIDLPRLIFNDLLRVTGRPILSAPRHARVMADSRSKYKYEILDR